MIGREQLPLKEGMLHRKRLDELLTLGLHAPLLTVIAGPGYGKTQAVARWAKYLPRRLLWLRLSRLDNSRDRFFMRFVQAAEVELPSLAHRLGKIGFPNSAHEQELVREILAEELACGPEAVFVLDDYESITEQAVRGFIRGILAARLNRLCVVVLSSQRADYNVSGLKNGGLVFPVTAHDLKFNEEEAQSLFCFYDRPLEGEACRELLTQTDGWPLALYVLALHCCGQQRGPVNLSSFLPVAAELFEHEYFLRYTPPVRELLVRLAAFPFFTIDVVRELYGNDLSAVVHAVALNAFIEYDYREAYFVFQKVYRSFLCQKQLLLEEEERARVYRIGGRWMMRAGKFYEAVECFFSAEAYAEMMDAILEIPCSGKTIAFSEFVLQYLEKVPESYRVAHPSVDLGKAYHYLNVGEHAHARALLLEIVSQDVWQTNRELLGEVYLALGDACLICNDMAFREYYRLARRCLPEGSQIRHAQVCFIAGTSVFLPDTRPGRLDANVRAILEIWPCVDAVSRGSGYGFEYVYAAQAAYMVCNLEESEELCYRAMFKGMEMGQHRIVCDALFQMMRIAICQGNYSRCEEHLRSLRRQIDGQESRTLRETLQIVENWYAVKMGNLQQVSCDACVGTRGDGEEKAQRGSRMTIWHSLCHTQCLMAKRQYREALAHLLYLQKKCGAMAGGWSEKLSMHILEAVCRLRLKQKQEAVQALWEAYSLTHQNHIYAPLMEEGNGMRALVEVARAQQALQFEAHWLDTVAQKSTLYAKRLAMVAGAYRKERRILPPQGIALSKREQDVLRMLGQGFRREEIAAACGITVHGVKKHITGIYNKLGAANRAEAIHIASAQGMLAR